MLRSIIISPDVELALRLETAATLTGEVSVNRVLDSYPAAIDLVRSLRAHAPDILFLNFESLEKAQEAIDHGVDSIVIDGAAHTFEENIKLVEQVVAYARHRPALSAGRCE